MFDAAKPTATEREALIADLETWHRERTAFGAHPEGYNLNDLRDLIGRAISELKESL